MRHALGGRFVDEGCRTTNSNEKSVALRFERRPTGELRCYASRTPVPSLWFLGSFRAIDCLARGSERVLSTVANFLLLVPIVPLL